MVFDPMKSILAPDMIFPQHGAIAQMMEANATVQRELERISRTLLGASENSFLASYIHQQKTIARQITLLEAPYADLMKQSGALAKIGEFSALAQFQSDRILWASSANKFLHLGLSRDVIGAVGAFTADEMLASRYAIEAIGILRPGFRTVADLALQGVVARGVAADVLHSYDAPVADTSELFAAVRDCVAVFDDPDATEGDVQSLLHRVLLAFGKAGQSLGADYQTMGHITFIGTLAAVLALFPSLQFWNDDPSKETKEVVVEVRNLRADFEAQRKNDEADRRHTRYVHRESNLRADADRHGMLLRVVYPDQLVHVLYTRGDWARVQVFDYTSAAPLEGWINRRNLRLNPA